MVVLLLKRLVECLLPCLFQLLQVTRILQMMASSKACNGRSSPSDCINLTSSFVNVLHLEIPVITLGPPR